MSARPAWWSRDGLTPAECATMDRHAAEIAAEGERIRCALAAEEARQEAELIANLLANAPYSPLLRAASTAR